MAPEELTSVLLTGGDIAGAWHTARRGTDRAVEHRWWTVLDLYQ
ncbi:MAG: hypothetical protein VX833_08310 [Actinomycetota bacterium]|nr:hypothetical protein [Actinomycetota bacterium]